MENLPAIVVLVAIIVLAVVLFRKRKPVKYAQFPETYRRILNEEVTFYQQLNAANKKVFEDRIQRFLSAVRITGVKTTVEDLDVVLVAASAIIPIFGFPDWEYMNLNEVLIYPEAFNHETFNEEGRNTLGVVGSGAYQNIMILSKDGLREGFANKTGKNNVAIHEFVHLIDKTDGAVDGIPEFMLGRQYILPWLDLIQKEMARIFDSRSDIDPYGTTSQAEFFAVVSEYFFERPDLLKTSHPDLYNLLSNIFRQQPVKSFPGE